MVARSSIHLDGRLGTSSPERWSVGFHFGKDGTNRSLTQEELADWVANAVSSLGSSGVRLWWQGIGANSTVDRIRAYTYDATGPAVRSQESNVTGQVGTGTPVHPFQCARVFSLQSSLPGASGRGRVYVPALVQPVDGPTGKATPATGLAQSLADWLNRMRAFTDGGPDTVFPAVYSRSKDLLTPVSGVRVGDVIDTQRRRRDALVEVYQSATI